MLKTNSVFKARTGLLQKKLALYGATGTPAWREGYFSQYSISFIFPHFTVFFFFFSFCLFWPGPTAHGSSQARGQIRAVAARLRHSTATWDPRHR